MVFLKDQTETKNGKEYTNHYFYHGNTYLGKADDGISEIQANIKDELGETVDPEKIEKLQEEAREKMENEVKDSSEDDLDLDLDLDHWDRAKKRENKGHLAVWEFANDRDVTVEIEENSLDDSTYDVLERVGGYTEHEIATNVFVEQAIEEAERAMLTANENKAEMADSGDYELSDHQFDEFSSVNDTDYVFEWVHDSEDLKVVVERDGDHSWSSRVYRNGDIEEEIVLDMIDPQKAMFRAEAWINDYENDSEYSMSDVEMIDADSEELAEMFESHWRSRPELWNIAETEDGIRVTFRATGESFLFGTSDSSGDSVEYILQGEGYESLDSYETQSLESRKNWNLNKAFDTFMSAISQYQQDYDQNNELSDIEAKPPEIGDEFYHVRVRDPSKYETERVPDWASDVASSVSKGSKVKMGKLGQCDWEVQSVMIKKSNVDRKKAKDLAEEIAMKIDNSDSEISDSGMVSKIANLSVDDVEDMSNREAEEYMESIGFIIQEDVAENYYKEFLKSMVSGDMSDRFGDAELKSYLEDRDKKELIDILVYSRFKDREGLEKWPKENLIQLALDAEKDEAIELSDSGTDIFAGDDFADRIANSELIYQDWDEDDVANIDDRSPLEPGDSEAERVNDEILLSEELKNIEELSENHREVYEMLKDDVDIHKGRVKQPESILKKLHEKYSEEVTDIIGVTIMADDKDEVMSVAEKLKSKHALYPIGEERADENHYEEDGFYRAYHLIIEVEHDGEKYPAEVQIKTEEQAKLHGLAHEYYKRNEDMPELLEEKARQLESGEIDSVDVEDLKNKLP